MYQVLGRSVTKNADGTITVKVEIIDDRTARTVRFQDYTLAAAGFRAALSAAITTDLKALVAAETDATLNAAIVNQQLGAI